MNNYCIDNSDNETLFDEIETLVEDLYEQYKDLKNDCNTMPGLWIDYMNNESPHLETFQFYDSEIKEGLMAHVKVGIYLSRIARKRLYQLAKIKTFKEYCTKHLNKTSSYCVRLIKAAKTTLELMIAGFDRLPTNEAQCRPLTNIASSEELRDKWQEVLDRADKNSKGVITASMITEVVNGESEPVEKKSVKISAQSLERLERLAKKIGKPVNQLIDEAISKLEFEYEAEQEQEEKMTDCPLCGGTGENGEDDNCSLCEGEGLVTLKDANWYADLLNLSNQQRTNNRLTSRPPTQPVKQSPGL